MRLFVGVELDDPVRAACAAAARVLERKLSRARADLTVRWTAESNLHITLWFLGEVPDAEAEAIVDALRPAWNTAAFEVSVSGAGAFPPSGQPRIIWFGVTAGAERMVDLHRELSGRLTRLAFEPERRSYKPHITVGRVKEAGRVRWSAARSALAEADVRGGTSHVQSVTLFRSRLSPAGARYEPLLRVPLKEC